MLPLFFVLFLGIELLRPCILLLFHCKLLNCLNRSTPGSRSSPSSLMILTLISLLQQVEKQEMFLQDLLYCESPLLYYTVAHFTS